MMMVNLLFQLRLFSYCILTQTDHTYTNSSPNKLNFIFSLWLRLTHLCTVDIKVVYSEQPLQATVDIISFAQWRE